MFNYKTEYALNKKDPLAIVYQDAYGLRKRILKARKNFCIGKHYWMTAATRKKKQSISIGITPLAQPGLKNT